MKNVFNVDFDDAVISASEIMDYSAKRANLSHQNRERYLDNDFVYIIEQLHNLAADFGFDLVEKPEENTATASDDDCISFNGVSGGSNHG